MKLGFAVLLTGATACAHCQYQLIDMGNLDGGRSFAIALNSHGQMVGGVQRSNGEWHAGLWDNGVLTDLGTLGGNESQAWDINESGQVVGYAFTLETRRPFLWQNGQMVDIVGGGQQAMAINNAGLIVTDKVGNSGLWFHEPGGIVRYVPGNGHASVTGVNDDGTAVGVDYVVSGGFGASRPFAWTPTQTTQLPVPAAIESEAWDISDSGVVCGDVGARAVIWQDGQMTYLDDGSLDFSAAFAVNDSGDAVGCISSGASQVAALFSNGQITVLNDLVNEPEWDLFSGIGISDAGVIVGSATKNGLGRGFALVPPGVQWATVPEPAGLSVLAFGLLLIAKRRRQSG